MEVDPLYRDWLSVVDDDEFSLLSKLDYWEPVGDDSLRRVEGAKVYVVMREAEWLRHQEICERVELECESLDAAIATDQAEVEMQRLLAKPKVETVDPSNHPENGKHPSWPANPFASSFIMF